MRHLHVIKRSDAEFFGTQPIWKVLLKVAPPVMLAQLIQALYNVVDSFFVGKFSGDGLTALSVIYPIQLIITALAVGMGVGVNTQMSRLFAKGRKLAADRTGGTGIVLAVVMWAIFAVISALIVRPFASVSAASPAAVEYAVTYGLICCVGSIGVFLEGVFSKIHQARGNMVLPMIAQIAGALVNIALDPVFIFGLLGCKQMGVAGAAWATVLGQVTAAIITGITGFRRPPAIRKMWKYVKRIFLLGYPSILMQALYTVYIVALNFILVGFSDAAVIVLGLYYKMQSFFFIPLFGLQTCIVPVLSYNYTRGSYTRVNAIMRDSFLISGIFMFVGIACFEFIPHELIGLFSSDPAVFRVGETAFRIIGASFLPAVFSLMLPVFFQAIGHAVPSAILSLMRQIFYLISLFWGFSLIGLDYAWIAFPAAELITGTIGLILYFREVRKWKRAGKLSPSQTPPVCNDVT